MAKKLDTKDLLIGLLVLVCLYLYFSGGEIREGHEGMWMDDISPELDDEEWEQAIQEMHEQNTSGGSGGNTSGNSSGGSGGNTSGNSSGGSGGNTSGNSSGGSGSNTSGNSSGGSR